MLETIVSTPSWGRAPIGAFSEGLLTDDPLCEEANLGVWRPNVPALRVLEWLRNSKGSPFKDAILGGADNAFTQENTVESEADQVKKAIGRFDPYRTVRYKSVLTRNLLALFDGAKEEDSNSPGIAIGSLRSFLRFMQLYPTLRMPAISLTPEYHVYISWKVAKNKLFSVRFLPNGDVRFVVFTQNKLHPHKIDRLYGITTPDLIMQTIEAYDIRDWIRDEGRPTPRY